MPNDSATPSPVPDVSQAHVRELIERGKTDYRVFHLIDTQDDVAPELREAVVAIVELNVREELKQGEAIRNTAQQLLPRDGGTRLFKLWRTLLEKAAPDRKAMKEVCADFVEVVDAVGLDVLEASIEFVGKVLSVHGRFGLEILRGHLGEALRTLPGESRAVYIEWLNPYVESAYDRPFGGLARIVGVLVANGESDLLAQLKGALPTKAFEEEVPPDKFAVKCGEGLDRVPRALQPTYARLVSLIAVESCGSAAGVGARLPKKLEMLAPERRADYLDCFTRLVQSAGVRTAGFCLKKLHAFMVDGRSAAAYVDQVCAVGQRYGASAAAAFVEQRTAASRHAWPGA